MKNLFLFAFFIGSARPSFEQFSSNSWWTCASTNPNPITFVEFKSPKPFKEYSITNEHAEMEVHAIEQGC